MSATRFGTAGFLEYNTRYSVLICCKCQYAIQKNAVESHLLRHKIYRGERQRLLSELSRVRLIEPHEVLLPSHRSPPVDNLPVLSGYCCTAKDCTHLAVSSKRMKRHWVDVHGLDGSVSLSVSLARPVGLQTFFRGTKLRYFEVASIPSRSSDTGDVEVDNDDNDAGIEENFTGTFHHDDEPKAGSALVCHSPHPSKTFPDLVLADFSMEVLRYFHHFTMATLPTLPPVRLRLSTSGSWQYCIVRTALEHRWLMCGLLAISAYHCASSEDGQINKQAHLDRGAQFYSELLKPTTREEAENLIEQIDCLIRCARWNTATESIDQRAAYSERLKVLMAMIQGCADPVPVVDLGKKTPSRLHEELTALPFRIADVLGKPDNTQDVFTTLKVIELLIQCCDLSFTGDEASVACQSAISWLYFVPDHFKHMLEQLEPVAFLLTAHWAAILVTRAEKSGCWYLEGMAKSVLEACGGVLKKEDSVWRLLKGTTQFMGL